MGDTFKDRIRSFFGFGQVPPKNDFRNPIWGSDDDDDDDELYTKHNYMAVFEDHRKMQDITERFQKMFQTFSNVFGDVKFFLDDHGVIDSHTDNEIKEPENLEPNNLRDYYLKPGYQENTEQYIEDVDLDGKISSDEISRFLQRKEEYDSSSSLFKAFSGNIVPGGFFSQTIITTSVTKPDGTVEMRRIIKNGNEIIEDKSTTLESQNEYSIGPDNAFPTDIIFRNLSDFMSIADNFRLL